MKRFFCIFIVMIIVINFSSPIMFAVEKNENTNIAANKVTTTNKNESKENTYDTTNEEKSNVENNTDTEALLKNEVLIGETKARMWIDSPTGSYIEGKSVNVSGWAMCNDSKATLKVYIDGNDTKAEITRIEREDVLRAEPGYGGRALNPKPGFIAKVDLSKITYGNHTIKYAVVDEDGVEIQKIEKAVSINNKTKARMWIDSPTGSYIEGKSVNVSGWAMCNDSKATLKVYIDGNDTKAEITRIEREDVLRAEPGYGGRTLNPKPGFIAKVDLSKITYGNHTIKYAVVDEDGVEIQKIEKAVTINNKAKARMWIDSPTGSYIEGKSVNVSGWAMCNDSKATLKVYIDGNDTKAEITRIEREDVLRAEPGYGGRALNPKPGFTAKVDLSKITYGNHTIKYAVVDEDGVEIQKIEKAVTINNKAKARMWIDSPTGSYIEGKSVNVSGWAMCNDSKVTLKVYIDGNDTKAEITRIEREDVLRAEPGYGGRALNPKPGFIAKVDLSKITYGNHTIKYAVVDEDGVEIQKIEKAVTINNKAKARMWIDSPTGSYIEGKSVNVSGWAMCNDSKATLKVYIDGNDTKAEITRTEREDVLRAEPGYGGRALNPKPGFIAKVDLSKITYGNHTIKYAILDENGVEIQKIEKTVTIDSRTKAKIQIDSPIEDSIEGNTLNIIGWYLCNAKSNIKLYIDGEEKNIQLQKIERPDVLRIETGYGGKEFNPTPGYKISVDITNYAKGKNHKVKIAVVDENNNEITVKEKEIKFFSNDKGELCVDLPTRTTFYGEKLTFVGWEMSQLSDSEIKFYVDGKETQVEISRLDRKDVISAMSWKYGGIEVNPTPGFEIGMDLTKCSKGAHNVTIKLYSKEGKLLATKSKNIFVIKDIYFGIDVSTHQKDINWRMAKQEGVNYAIIRIGYGQTLSNIDKFFVANYNSCVQNGIPVGVYTYSYALNVEEARLEAEAVIKWLNHRNLQLPVFWDVEDNCQSNIDRDTLTAMADTFCSIIRNNGYQAGIYGNKNWLTNKLNMNYLRNQQKYDVWVAQYNYECTYEGDYDIWQYSSTERLSGINGNVDCNYFYKKY